VLDAQYFGVPQRRRRVFIVGCIGNSGGSPEEILAIAEGRAGYLAKGNKKRQDTASGTSRGVATGSTVGALTVADLTKGQGNHQGVAAGLLQVVDVVR
jgi:DNA (cytosine-5)-methyltransferase 1